MAEKRTKTYFCLLGLLPTALTWQVMQSPPSIHPSFCPFVSILSFYLWNQLTGDLELLHLSRSLL